MALAVLFKCRQRIVEVKKAFVNAPLNKEIFIEQLKGFVVEGKEEVFYILRRSLYGLRPSSRE